MIDKTFITAQGVRWQTAERNVVREYSQHWFLSVLYKQKEAAGLFFKGGTALRILFDSPRFSEDLDFSSRIDSIHDLENIVQDVLVQLSYEGILLTIRDATPTAGGYLFTADTVLFDVAFSIKLNIIFQTRCTGETHVVNSAFLPPYAVTALAREDIVQEKVQAFLTRIKPRDVFDLYFLLRSPWARRAVLAHARDIQRILNAKEISVYQLKDFLPKSFWPVITDLKNNIGKELKK